ncbi:pentapeptide repeat-containing protein [Shewanella sp. HL-SH8]|uniref:pentapeptide repeat-containing protein n=1 Tax=Shewanella sp. HL-SH8 TaxID=3436242 RepID=UPI003EBD5AA0
MIKLQDNQQYYNKTFNDLVTGSIPIYGAEFEECEFSACDFASTTFAHCKFVNCHFNHCNFSLAKVDYSQFLEVSFIECKMIGINWTKANWPKFTVNPELSFIRCIINDSSFFGLTLHGLILEECKVHDVDFRGATLPTHA